MGIKDPDILLKLMMKHQCRNIVFASSGSVYGEQQLAAENDPVKPVSSMGQLYADKERFIKKKHTDGIKPQNSAVCLRYFNV
jgi:UDP-glucose 4-epimerase